MKRRNLTPLLGLLAVLAAGLMFFAAIEGVERGHAGEDKAQLETALRRGAAACYAAEGAYPADLAYLTENYGIEVNEKRYTVIYRFVASNLMPEITVMDETNES